MANTPFTPDRDGFFARMKENEARTRATIAVAKTHLNALAQRLARVSQALDDGHPGIAGSVAELAQRDWDALLNSLRTPDSEPLPRREKPGS